MPFPGPWRHTVGLDDSQPHLSSLYPKLAVPWTKLPKQA